VVPSGLTSVVEGSYPHPQILAKRVGKIEGKREKCDLRLYGGDVARSWFELARDL
jgi:hypothetical protein